MRRTVIALATVAAVTAATVTPASAAPIASDLVSPLSAAVAEDGTAYVAQNFAGLLMEVPVGGDPAVAYAAPKQGTEVGAVSVAGDVVSFATTKGRKTHLLTMTAGGDATRVANIGAYESTANPDGDATYGFKGLSRNCKKGLPPFLLPYKGIVESHPYATLPGVGTTYIADAAANAILAAAPDGTVSTVAVMPNVPVKVNRQEARANGLPRCVAGHTFRFEFVPTDVELGPDGMLYVSSLPGGPEDGSLGANGSVWRVDPATGDSTKVVGGLLSPVGVAVADNGDLYVSQLFAGQIVKVPAGSSTPEPYKSVKLPGDVEWTPEAIYATTNVLSDGKGKLVRWDFPA